MIDNIILLINESPQDIVNHADLAQFIDELKHSTLIGKGLRGKMMLDSVIKTIRSKHLIIANLNDISKLKESLLNIAVSLELFQTSMLIHDDIIDGDEIRRGKMAAWKSIGKDQAILLGDLVLSHASRLFSDSVLQLLKNDIISQDTATKLNNCYNEMVNNVIYGQVLDYKYTEQSVEGILTSLEDKIETERNEVLLNIAQTGLLVALYKTASYTFISPFEIGTLIGGDCEGISDDERAKLKYDGIMFQLQNDLDGFTDDYNNGNFSVLMGLTMFFEISKINSGVSESELRLLADNLLSKIANNKLSIKELYA